MKPLTTAALVLTLLPGTAQAMTCEIGSVTELALGTYNVFSSAPLDSSGLLRYTCSDVGVSDTIVIQLSRGSSATYLPRTLLNGAFVLEYNIYLDAARTSVWGDGSAGTGQHGPVQPVSGNETTLDVYGRIPPGQNAHVGSYADTVTVTIVF